jgi:hypothetical protein
VAVKEECQEIFTFFQHFLANSLSLLTMARNEEKALTLFNKWQTFKKDYHAGEQNRRPLVSAECQSLPEAEKFRREIVQNISKKIATIQNGTHAHLL